MFSKHINKFSKHDDYMTPKYVWEDIKEYIPKDKVIWEAFYGDGKSGSYLHEIGFNVIHRKVDFFENNLGDIVVSNPPFTKKILILKRLVAINKPFILILPILVITCKYFRELFKNESIQIIIPKKRIYFNKIVDGKKEELSRPSFDCLYYCWKMNLPKDIIYLE